MKFLVGKCAFAIGLASITIFTWLQVDAPELLKRSSEKNSITSMTQRLKWHNASKETIVLIVSPNFAYKGVNNPNVHFSKNKLAFIGCPRISGGSSIGKALDPILKDAPPIAGGSSAGKALGPILKDAPPIAGGSSAGKALGPILKDASPIAGGNSAGKALGPILKDAPPIAGGSSAGKALDPILKDAPPIAGGNSAGKALNPILKDAPPLVDCD